MLWKKVVWGILRVVYVVLTMDFTKEGPEDKEKADEAMKNKKN